VKLTTHLHLVPRSGMSGAIPSLPIKPSRCGALLKHRDNFTYTFFLLASSMPFYKMLQDVRGILNTEILKFGTVSDVRLGCFQTSCC